MIRIDSDPKDPKQFILTATAAVRFPRSWVDSQDAKDQQKLADLIGHWNAMIEGIR